MITRLRIATSVSSIPHSQYAGYNYSMSLNVLSYGPSGGSDDLLRMFLRTELHWTRHLAQETALDVGMAMSEPSLARVSDANRMLDVVMPNGMTPVDAVQLANQHFGQCGVLCRKWLMHPAARVRNEPLVQHLRSQGFVASARDVLHWDGSTAAPLREEAGLKVIPAQASFRHARQLAEERAATICNEPQVADAAMLHLDDAHVDGLLAMRNGLVAAGVCVLAVGDIGRIEDLYVIAVLRRHGIGRTMLSRALEICVRCLFKHVLVAIKPDNQAAYGLFAKAGFKNVGQVVEYGQ